jgi:DMSO/TMAO reductase YedYZ molybdopterin-dependent catalytic subunit
MARPDFVFPGQAAEEELVPFQNVPRSSPNSLDWETLTEWLTPQDQVFSVQHYGVPEFDAAKFELEITGLVERPRKLRLDDLKALSRQEQLMTLECSGNGSSPGFSGAVYNSRRPAHRFGISPARQSRRAAAFRRAHRTDLRWGPAGSWSGSPAAGPAHRSPRRRPAGQPP